MVTFDEPRISKAKQNAIRAAIIRNDGSKRRLRRAHYWFQVARNRIKADSPHTAQWLETYRRLFGVGEYYQFLTEYAADQLIK